MDRGRVLVDGDIIAYRAAYSTEESGPTHTRDKVSQLMDHVLSETVDLPFPVPSEYQTYLTGSGNFRHDIAKSYPYKGNRKFKDKPKYLGVAREFLIQEYGAIVSSGEEADDLISMEAARLNYDCVVASVDKDMLQIPCWHFNFGRNEWSKVDPFGGDKFFYTQILTGDNSDNIVGLYGIGPKKAAIVLANCRTDVDLWYAVVKAYDGDVERVLENARLLWLRRYEGEIWEPPKTGD